MPLLTPADPPPVTIHNADAASPFLVLCDHAGRRVPEKLGDLGLPAAEFERHIAWDIGAGGLSRRLGERLGACVIEQTYSRLVIDCNRWPDAADCVPDLVDGTSIAANFNLSAAAAIERRAEIYMPYHDAISAVLDARAGRDVPTRLILMHSFTPRLAVASRAEDRPWHVGVLHAHDSPLSDAMLRLLRAEPGYVIGDNQPYAMDGADYTAPHHAGGRGLDYCELEVRQDLIASAEGQAHYADLLARLLIAALG
jgi:predicted N-formylglutamate amidohydrolase